jgi:predicted thioesterase
VEEEVDLAEELVAVLLHHHGARALAVIDHPAVRRRGLGGEQDLASVLNHITGDTYPGVFATTRAIALCQLTTGRVLAPLLSEGELSVGVVLEVGHTAATPPGARVSATARHTDRDGKLYFFEVSVKDSAGEVMTGVHKRAIIQLSRLLEGGDNRR